MDVKTMFPSLQFIRSVHNCPFLHLAHHHAVFRPVGEGFVVERELTTIDKLSNQGRDLARVSAPGSEIVDDSVVAVHGFVH